MIISLGSNCSISFHKNNINNNTTLPFDWCKINITQLIKVLQNNFNNYHNLYIYKYSSNHNSYIIKNDYNVKFAHELLNKYDLNNFKNKLEERISKFNDILLNNKTKIIFVRIELNKYKKSYNLNLIKLYNILKSLYKDFELRLILHKSYQNSINISTLTNIKIFYFNNFDNNWRYPLLNWKSILNYY